MPAPTKILELVERFHCNLRAYEQAPYNEAQARIEYIDPLFIALGWDVNNAQGLATQPHDPEVRPRSSAASR